MTRQEKLKEFKSGYKQQQVMFTEVPRESEGAIHALHSIQNKSDVYFSAHYGAAAAAERHSEL